MIYKKITTTLRTFRKYHKVLGITLAILLTISALTGILLALKKNVDLIQPPTQKGTSNVLNDWKPVAELALLAKDALVTAQPAEIDNEVDRMDVRPSKGIVKVLFKKGWWEVQVDGSTGEIRSIAKRHSDWIEALHDGSIVSDGFKLLSMNVLGWGLLVMVITGLWLWYGPRRVRYLRRRRSE